MRLWSRFTTGSTNRQVFRAAVMIAVSLSSIVARYEALYQNSVVPPPSVEGKTGEVAFQRVRKNA